MSADRDLPLSEIPGFPPDVTLNWTLGKLLERVVTVAQFNCGRWTFDEAMFEAFRGVVERDKLAAACRDAVMGHIATDEQKGAAP